MQDEIKPFLDEGVRQYAAAKATVLAFEQAMRKSLEAAVKSREWSPMKGKRVGRATLGSSTGGNGYWIALSIIGQSPRHEETEIDCGIWWNCNAPGITEPIVYARYYYKPKRLVGFRWQKKRGIYSFCKNGKTFLYAPLAGSAEISKPLNQLLDALLKQLA